MPDRADLARVEVAHQLQDDGGAGLLAVAFEQAALWQDEVDAGGLDAADRPDRARQLAFQRAQVVHVLDEIGRGEGVALVEDLVSDAGLAREALAGKVHAQAGQVGARRHHRLAGVAPGLVSDAAGVEVAHDGGRVLGRQVGEQHAHVRAGDPQDDEGEESDQRQRHRRHRREARRSELGDEIENRLHGCYAPTPSGRRWRPHPAEFAWAVVSGRLTNDTLWSAPGAEKERSRTRGNAGTAFRETGFGRADWTASSGARGRVSGGNAGCAWCAVRQGRAGRSRTASSETPQW